MLPQCRAMLSRRSLQGCKPGTAVYKTAEMQPGGFACMVAPDMPALGPWKPLVTVAGGAPAP